MLKEGRDIGSEKNKHLEKFLNVLQNILPNTPYQMEDLEFLFDIQRHELFLF
jgi:hypothetical protein